MTKKAYLYGEIHGSEIINKKESEIWQDFYNRGFRHLFMELPYFYVQFLNLWMKSGDDSILDELWKNGEGTAGNSVFDREFLMNIKKFCPETVIHGTDIGHAYDTTGKRYLESVSPDSEEYRIAEKNIEQGRKYYEAWQENVSGDYTEADRENCMAKNFIREFDSVDAGIVGFYGEAHVFSAGTGNFGIRENMYDKIRKHYGENAFFAAELMKNIIEPLYKTEITLCGKNYIASCFGDVYTPFDDECEYIRIFRIEKSGTDFSRYPRKENFIPEMLYPCAINKNDVFAVDSLKNGEKISRQIFICDGFSEEFGNITTEICME